MVEIFFFNNVIFYIKELIYLILDNNIKNIRFIFLYINKNINVK